MVVPLPLIPWIILFSPFAAALLICFFFMKSPRTASLLATVGILVSLAGSVFLFAFHTHHNLLPSETAYPWIHIASLNADFGFLHGLQEESAAR